MKAAAETASAHFSVKNGCLSASWTAMRFEGSSTKHCSNKCAKLDTKRPSSAPACSHRKRKHAMARSSQQIQPKLQQKNFIHHSFPLHFSQTLTLEVRSMEVRSFVGCVTSTNLITVFPVTEGRFKEKTNHQMSAHPSPGPARIV